MYFSCKSVIAGIMLAGLLGSCAKSGKSHETEFDKVSVVRDISLTKDGDSPQCKININAHFAKDSNGDRAKAMNAAVISRLFSMEKLTMEQAADSFANVYTRNYADGLAKLYEADRAYPDRHVWYEYRYELSTEVQSGRNGAVVYIASLDYFEGGAHGVQQKIVMNFDADSGKQLGLGDVFVPGYETRLNDILLSELEKKTGTRSLDELHDKGYLYSMGIFAPENFILGEDAVTFIYNVYEIAPYSMGLTELTIKYSDLNELLPK